MKALIDALKDKCLTKAELIRIVMNRSSNLSSEASRKRCERFLDRFQKLGLIEKRDGKYCWYIYLNAFHDDKDYSAKLSHSRNLIPAIRRIARIELFTYSAERVEGDNLTPEDMKILIKCAEDHLASYKDVWQLLAELRGLEEKTEKKRKAFEASLLKKLKNEFGEEPVDLGKVNSSKPQSFAGRNILLFVYEHIRCGRSMLPELKIQEDESLWLEGILVGKGKGMRVKLEKFLKSESEDEANIVVVSEIEKSEDEANKASRNLQREIRKLILRIDSGEPLLGECDTCPRVYWE